MVSSLGHAGLVTWQQTARPQVLACFMASLAGVEGMRKKMLPRRREKRGRGDMAGGGNWRASLNGLHGGKMPIFVFLHLPPRPAAQPVHPGMNEAPSRTQSCPEGWDTDSQGQCRAHPCLPAFLWFHSGPALCSRTLGQRPVGV